MNDPLFSEIHAIFHPRSMAAVGVRENPPNQGMSFLLGYRRLGFQGPLYAIHPTKKLAQFETLPSILEVPGPLDMVSISLPASHLPGLMRDCVKKQIRCAVIFTSGFRESGTPEGAALEDEVLAIARAGKVRIIGPNCMGLYCPESGVSLRLDMPNLPGGAISLVSQSGGVSNSLVMAAAERGIGFAKAVSYGNEADLGPVEFLHYLARDEHTRVIALYLEGTRRPAELRAALADAAARKPVVLLKGGTTALGSRAVASHTGALTGSGDIWRALARQTGCAWAEDLDELLDLSMLFALSRPPAGRRIGLLTISGGFGVYATDQITRAGFELPPLAPHTREVLAPLIEAPGSNLGNPVDMAAKFFQPQNYDRIFPVFDQDPNFDSYILILANEYMGYVGKHLGEWSGFVVKALIPALQKISAPVYVVLMHTAADDVRLAHERALLAARLPVFPTVARCLTALDRALKK